MKKLTKLMQWREEYGNTLIVASELENDYAQFFYFRGYDSFGSPIAWFRASVMPWGKVDIDAFVRMVVYQIDRAVATFMPRGTECFTCVIDATGIGGMQVFSIVKLLKKLADIFVNGFPDRLASLLVMPCSGTIQTIYGMIKGVLPASITKKVKLVDADVRQLSFSPYSLTISLSLSLSLPTPLSRRRALECACAGPQQALTSFHPFPFPSLSTPNRLRTIVLSFTFAGHALEALGVRRRRRQHALPPGGARAGRAKCVRRRRCNDGGGDARATGGDLRGDLRWGQGAVQF